MKRGVTLRIGMAVATAGLLFGGAARTASAQNLIANPGFEAPDSSGGEQTAAGSGWQSWNPWVSPFTGFITTAQHHAGTQAGKTFGGPNSGFYQFVPVTGGTRINASGWLLNSSSDPMNDPGQTVDLRLTFFDGPNGTGNNLGLVISPTNINSTTKDVWTQVSLSNVLVPASAQSVQWLAFENNPASQGGAFFVDDAALSLVPEPATLGVMALAALAALGRRRGGQR